MSRGTSANVVLCVGGGIAAYKTPELVRQLTKAGHQVQVLVTAAALAFVSELSLAVVSGRQVRHRLLDPDDEGRVGHIDLADWADIVVVAPATADLLARGTLGLADDLVTTVLLATRARIMWAPAMNTNMWRHVTVQGHVATLRGRGHAIIDPVVGELACGWEGEGKMAEPSAIARAVTSLLAETATTTATGASTSWVGRHVLVSAGPTRTYLDPVRFVSNASTGVMGFSIADVARELGAEVTLVAGPANLATPAGVRRVDVETNDQMLSQLEGCLAEGQVDVLCMVAAVCDLKLDEPEKTKLGKDAFIEGLPGRTFCAETDLVATLAQRFPNATRFLAFAAETADGAPDQVQAQLLQNARRKLERKGTDAIFVNRVGTTTTGMGSATNAGTLIFATPGSLGATPSAGKDVVSSGPPVAKRVLARWILDNLHAHWFSQHGDA